MVKIQEFITTIIYRFSTFKITPSNNYFTHIPLNSENITKEA
nr:MAG TPA_asm: hypothetical protein [Caudoviricetes sp.]